MRTPKEAVLAAFRRERPDYVPCMMRDVVTTAAPGNRNAPGTASGQDWWGVEWIADGSGGSTPAPGVHRLGEVAAWREELDFPDLDAFDWDGWAAGALAGVDRETYPVSVTVLSGLFERLHHLTGFEYALAAFYTEPEALAALLDALGEHRLRYLERVCRALRPDIVNAHDDWGHNGNLFFSPELWRRYFRPWEERFAALVHRHGAFYMHHSCGFITPLIPELAAVGVDAVNPLNACNDLKWIKERCGGRIALLGGIDNQVVDAPGCPETVIRAEVRRAMDLLAPGGGYLSMYVPTSGAALEIAVDEMVRYGRTLYGAPAGEPEHRLG